MTKYTENVNFFGNNTPHQLIEKFGSPLYIYNENILRERCQELVHLSDNPNFKVNYSAKANTNTELLKIIRSEGCFVDAMSPGELFLNQRANFKPEEILYVCNNVASDELKNALTQNVLISVDSLSQLETLGKVNAELSHKGEEYTYSNKVMLRLNPGIGAGHHKKVITAGKETKFGINPSEIDQAIKILAKYNMKLIGINQHIGSLFMEGKAYIEAMEVLLNIAEELLPEFPLEIIDFGGGFGIPYKKYENEPRLDMKELGSLINKCMTTWAKKHHYQGKFYIEPGRYIVAECGALLGTVHAIKENAGTHYIGTDLGFNTLQRPIMYDAYHDVELYQEKNSSDIFPQTVVGNICESGDILAKDRNLPKAKEGDIVAVLDTGAYGYAMASSYNQRCRPAEILIDKNGDPWLIRRRETITDLMAYL